MLFLLKTLCSLLCICYGMYTNRGGGSNPSSSADGQPPAGRDTSQLAPLPQFVPAGGSYHGSQSYLLANVPSSEVHGRNNYYEQSAVGPSQLAPLPQFVPAGGSSHGSQPYLLANVPSSEAYVIQQMTAEVRGLTPIKRLIHFNNHYYYLRANGFTDLDILAIYKADPNNKGNEKPELDHHTMNLKNILSQLYRSPTLINDFLLNYLPLRVMGYDDGQIAYLYGQREINNWKKPEWKN